MTIRDKQRLRINRAMARLSWERLTPEQVAYWRRMLDEAIRIRAQHSAKQES